MRQFLIIICFMLPCSLMAQIKPMEACIELKVGNHRMQPCLKVTDQTAYYHFDLKALSGDTVKFSIQSDYSEVYIIMIDGRGKPVVRLIKDGESNDTFVRNIVLDEVTGTEFYCLLFLLEPIDTQKLESVLSESDISNVHAQINTALGNKVAKFGKDVRFVENDIGFSCRENSRIVQVNMEVIHD